MLIKEIQRKSFHLLGLVYVWGIATFPRMTVIKILGPLVAVTFLFEMGRLNSQKLKDLTASIFGPLMREKENKKLTGFFWMLLGVLVTVLLLENKFLAMTAVSYLLFGDALASLGGKFIHGPKWPFNEKTIHGSLICFLACLGVGWVILGGQQGYAILFSGALAATILELGFFNFDDNFLVPAGSALWFKLWYDVFQFSSWI